MRIVNIGNAILICVIITGAILSGCSNGAGLMDVNANGGLNNNASVVIEQDADKQSDSGEKLKTTDVVEKTNTDVIYNHTELDDDNDANSDIDDTGNDTENTMQAVNVENGFTISDIDDELFDRIYGVSYKGDCTVPREELRYLKVMYCDFDGNDSSGEIICNRIIADKLITIFKALYEAHYPIGKIRLVDEYNAIDEESMADNNSSCFNFRFISYTTTVSKHGLGMAIDINPLYNPYVKTVNGQLSIEPANAADYVDRDRDFEHKIDENDLAYKLFTENGFSWGGAWKNSKDYQHFEYR